MNDILDERRGSPSASKAGQYELCPRSHEESKGFKSESSPEANDGTNQHKYMNGEPVVLREELKADCLEAERQRSEVMEFTFNNWRDRPPLVICEERMWFKDDRYSGVPDLLAMRNRRALIIDYKFGRVAVPHAKDNPQLKWLTVLADENYDVEEVTVAIIQPQCGNFTIATRDKDAIRKARRSVMSTLRKMEKDTTKLRPGPKQCKYCNAREACPALLKKADSIARINRVEALTPHQIAASLDMVEAVESACRAIKKRATEMLKDDPDAIPGYSLTRSHGRRSISDTAATCAVLELEGYVTTAEFLEHCSIGVGKVQQIIRDKEGVGSAAARKIASTLLKGYITSKEGDFKPCRVE